MLGNVPTGPVTGEVEAPALPTTGGLAAAELSSGPTETVEQRYLREQFAYIRERVRERLIYPPLARRQGWTGQVRVEFTICADGSIEGLKISASSGRALLDQQAMRAVRAAAPFPAPPAPAIVNLPVLFVVDSPHL